MGAGAAGGLGAGATGFGMGLGVGVGVGAGVGVGVGVGVADGVADGVAEGLGEALTDSRACGAADPHAANKIAANATPAPVAIDRPLPRMGAPRLIRTPPTAATRRPAAP